MAGRHEILAPSSQELDLTDEEAVRRYMTAHRVDGIIHSATTPGHRNAPHVPDLVARNLRMFFNLERNRTAYKKMVYLGSGAIYDMRHYQPKMHEDFFDVHVPADPHGFSKYVIGQYLEQGGRKVTELRLFGVFGKYEDYAIRFISNAICKALFNLPISIKQDRKFDYLYVNDLPAILEHFLLHNHLENVYNITPDESVSLLAIAEMVREISDSDVDIRVAQQGEGVEYSGDNARLHTQIPALQLTPIKHAIEELYEWYKSRINLLDRHLLMEDK